MLREHLTKSLRTVHNDLRGLAPQRPAWLQDGLAGALLMYAFILFRGGIIVLPIALIAYITTPSQRHDLGMILLSALILVPAAGFVGGVIYGACAGVLRPLGKAGKLIQFILAASVYGTLGSFLIFPLLDHEKLPPLSDQFSWFIAGLIGLAGGIALYVGSQSQGETPTSSSGAA